MEAIDELKLARLFWDKRADLIRQARAQGRTWEEIADAAQLSRATVIELAKTV